MPMTPADSETPLSDKVVERVEDTVDTFAHYAGRRPWLTVFAAFALGYLASRALV